MALAAAGPPAMLTRRAVTVQLGVSLLLVVFGQWQLTRPDPGVAGVVTWVAGIVLFAVAVRDADSADGTDSAERVPGSEAMVGLRRSPTALPWAIAAAVLTVYVWVEVRARPEDAGHGGVVLAWVGAIAALAVAVCRPRRISPRRLADVVRRHRVEALMLAAIGALAAALRFWRLDSYPSTFSADEAQFGLGARDVLSGALRSPFSTGWLAHPTLFSFVQSLPMRAIGDGVAGARAASAALGTATVLLTYWFARSRLGSHVALVAAALLATFHAHLFFSRVALNNVSDPFFTMLALLLLDRAVFRGRRGAAFAAGLTIGLAQYFYPGARALFAVAVVAFLLALALDRRGDALTTRALRLAPPAALVAAGAAVAIVPLAAHAADHWADVQARTDAVSVFASGWLEHEQQRTGDGAVTVMARHAGQAALVPFATEPHGSYRGSVPFVGWPLAVAAALGLGVATLGLRQRRYVVLAAAFWLAVAALTLTEGDPPPAHRFAAALPMLCVFAAVAVVAASRIAAPAGRPLALTGAVAVATVSIAMPSVHRHFRAENQPAVYSDLNTEVAATLAAELRRDGPRRTVYFAGPLRMSYDGFPNLRFLTPSTTGITLGEPLTPDSDRPLLPGPATFVFLPERAAELDVARAWFPDGRRRSVAADADGDGTAELLYVEWIVDGPR
ncbi:MAG: ArnT family glycosyltransferase [Acidimicrobiales bacterium]